MSEFPALCIVDEKKSSRPLLGEGDRLRLSGIQQSCKLCCHNQIPRPLHGDPALLERRGEYVRPRVAGIDAEFLSDGRRNYHSSVESAEQIELVDSCEADQGTGIGHDQPSHRAVLSSSANSFGG